MSRIPRKAQRAIDAANRARASAAPTAPKEPPQAPKRLDIKSMPGAYCRLFDVYFNGQLQTHCMVADAEHGYVIRYLNCTWDPVHRCMKACPPYDTERLEGQVTIRRKGAVDDMRKGAPLTPQAPGQ